MIMYINNQNSYVTKKIKVYVQHYAGQLVGCVMGVLCEWDSHSLSLVWCTVDSHAAQTINDGNNLVKYNNAYI